jgi:ribosomal protein S18 acetylase RimI-like enzyme
MYVAPAARGQGVGRRMLAHLEQSARESGAEAVVLETGLRQPEAIALYEACGYTPVPAFGYYRDGPLSRCFGKRLPTTT